MSINQFLNSDGQVTVWPKKHANKQLVCEYLVTKFEDGRMYHENEVNEILKSWHTFHDWPLLRRELFERHLMDRNRSGTEYTKL